MKSQILEVGWIIKIKGKTAFGGWVFDEEKDVTEFDNPVDALNAYGYKLSDLFEISTRWKEFADKRNTIPDAVFDELKNSDD